MRGEQTVGVDADTRRLPGPVTSSSSSSLLRCVHFFFDFVRVLIALFTPLSLSVMAAISRALRLPTIAPLIFVVLSYLSGTYMLMHFHR